MIFLLLRPGIQPDLAALIHWEASGQRWARCARKDDSVLFSESMNLWIDEDHICKAANRPVDMA